MRQLDLIILYVLSIRSVSAADTPRPRGVGPECLQAQTSPMRLISFHADRSLVAKYYKDPSNFACISVPSVRLPVSRVNDDFCDCPDGSDEPGTAACSHLSPLSPHALGDVIVDPTLNQTPSLPGYYCKNKGHQPSYIPFNLLNDGVCDHGLCCDGSDEWAHVGGTKCEDKCKEIGAEWRKNDEQRQKSMGMALKRQKELVGQAAKLRDEVAVRVQDLEVQVQAAEVKIKGLEREVEKVERQERGKVVRKPKEGGKLGVLVQLAKDRTAELREALLEVKDQRDSGKTRLEELEGIMRTFHEEYNPNFNDEGVKRAVRAWEEYVAKDKHDSGSEARDRDLEEIARSEEEAGTIKWGEFQEAEESDIDVREW